MENKICFKCNLSKPLNDFYKHPKTRDGHLNKCKSCNKLDSKSDYYKKAEDPEWLAKENERGREKSKRLNYPKKKTTPEIKLWVNSQSLEVVDALEQSVKSFKASLFHHLKKLGWEKSNNIKGVWEK